MRGVDEETLWKRIMDRRSVAGIHPQVLSSLIEATRINCLDMIQDIYGRDDRASLEVCDLLEAQCGALKCS